MGKLIAIENNGQQPLYVGSEMVAPGDCRHFDENLVPDHLRPAAAAAVPEGDGLPPVMEDAVAKAFGNCAPEDLVMRILEATGSIPDGFPDVAMLTDARDRAKALLEAESAALAPRKDVVDALSQLQLAIGDALIAAQEQAQAEAAAAAERERLAAEEKARADAEAKHRAKKR